MAMVSTRVYPRLQVLHDCPSETYVNVAFARRSASRGGRCEDSRSGLFDSRRDRTSSIASDLRLSIDLRACLAARSIRCRYLLYLTRASFQEGANVTRKENQEDSYSAFYS